MTYNVFCGTLNLAQSIAWPTSSPMISGSNSPDLSPLDYQAWGQLQQKPKTVPEFKHALQLIWSALPEKAIDNSVKDYHKRLQSCVSANGGHFDHFDRWRLNHSGAVRLCSRHLH